MMPAKVRYSGGIEVEPWMVINRCFEGPTPPEWTRHQFYVESLFSDPGYALNEWLANNIHGRWTINSQFVTDGMVVVIGFEDDTDAVMFRLMDGDTAWRQDNLVIS